MQDLGKLIALAGVVLFIVGLLIWKTGGLGPLGRLPGDIQVKWPNGSFYFPIVTCIVISALLTILNWIFRR